jgi:glycosyltransferase involved in cell wall biosynthesis
MAKKVSVIIPAFNAELFIADAIRSVLAQKSTTELEIIVIDDGSTDNTTSVVSDMAKHNYQVVLLRNNRSKGPSGARNTGLLKSTGDYISFLDADDLWLENHLEEGLNFLENRKDVDVVFYNFEIQDYVTKRKIGDWFAMRDFLKTLKTKELYEDYYLIVDDIFDALLNESFIHLQSMIIRTESIKRTLFNEKIRYSEDRDFSINLYLNSKTIFAFKNIITGIYNRHANSLTSNKYENAIANINDNIYIFNEYMLSNKMNKYTKKKLNRLIFDCYVSTIYYYRQLNCHKLALESFFQSFRYGISISQPKEFTKVFASFVRYSIFQLFRIVLENCRFSTSKKH